MDRSILIVDDHADFRLVARRILEHAGYVVVGEAGDAASAVRAVRATRPDIVVLDIQLPDRDGISLAQEIAHWPDPPTVILVSSREAADYGTRLGAAPALGFVSKEELSAAAIEDLLTKSA